MGSKIFEEKPNYYTSTISSGQTLDFMENNEQLMELSDATTKFCKGMIVNSKETFFMRLWLVLSNPLRYILTGRIRY